MSIDATLLRDFAALKKQEKEIKTAVEDLKGKVLANLLENHADEVEIPEVGKMVVVPKRAYTYPAEVVRLEGELKKAKQEAEAKGTATYTENPFIRFDALKELE